MMIMKAQDANVKLEIFQDDEPLHPREEFDNLGTMVCFHSRYNLGDKNRYLDPADWLEDIVSLDEYPISIVKNAEKKFEHLSVTEDEDGTFKVVDSDGETFVEELSHILVRYRGYESKEDAEDALQELIDDYIDDTPSEELMEIFEEHAVVLPLFLYDHSGITMKTSPFMCPWDSGQVGYIYATLEDLRKEFDLPEQELREKGKEILEGEVKHYDQYLTGDVYGFTLEESEECKECGHIEWNEVDSCWGFFGQDWDHMKDHVESKYQYLFDELEDTI